MQPQHAWWVLALVLGVLEIVSGTLYLFVFAAACAVAGVAAAVDASLLVQVLAMVLVASLGWLWLYRRSLRRAGRSG